MNSKLYSLCVWMVVYSHMCSWIFIEDMFPFLLIVWVPMVVDGVFIPFVILINVHAWVSIVELRWELVERERMLENEGKLIGLSEKWKFGWRNILIID